MRQVARGDPQAMGALYDRYARSVWSIGRGWTGDDRSADAIVQDVMIRLWRSARRFDPQRGALVTWVTAIARNAAIDQLRARGRSTAPHGDLDDLPAQPDLGAGAAPHEVLDRLLLSVLIEEALSRLTRDHRQMIDLGYFRGMTQREIAAETGLPLGTVKSRTYYALQSLRLACDELGVEE